MRYQFALLLSLALSPAIGNSAEPGTLRLDDGSEVRTLSAGPEDSIEAILMVHDWFGFSPFLSGSADRLAASGRQVLAVDLYEGKSATTHQEAWQLLQALDADAAAAKIDAALASLEAERIAIIGFSMGAPHALNAAIRNSGSVVTAVVFYGATINDPGELAKMSGPVLAIYGSKDGPAADNAATFSKAADEAGIGAEIFVYPGAHHAFAQPLFNQGETYDPEATSVMWLITEDFLRRRLGS